MCEDKSWIVDVSQKSIPLISPIFKDPDGYRWKLLNDKR